MNILSGLSCLYSAIGDLYGADRRTIWTLYETYMDPIGDLKGTLDEVKANLAQIRSSMEGPSWAAEERYLARAPLRTSSSAL